jgi:DNA-binding transcriptional regulator LsrR (DeoR family)
MPRDESPNGQELRRSGRLARNRIRIAWMYYVEGLTQNEIAEKLDIGRVTVVRNINEALKQREVKIWIEGDIAECLDLEKQLRQTFGLEEAVVVPEPSNPANIARSIGVAAGMYITDRLHSDMSIGVGWGTTLHDALQTLAPKDVENLKVVSLMGGILQARHYNPSEFAWQFARITDADCYLLPAPALVDSPATRTALIERCGLADVFKRAERLDMAVMSVGYIAAGSSTFKVNLVSESERAELVRMGAVGDVLCHFYDREGNLVDHSVNDRVMSIPIPTLRKVPRRVIASGGAEKVEALLGAMKLINCNALITTEATAQELLIRKK